jgi:dTDP-4-dehydrorhamnose 3,5-epimerase-like enzyme
MHKIFKDDRGCLFPIEINSIPFDVKRVFTVYGVPTGTIRGEHAHFKTKQYLFCVKGKIQVYLDDGIKVKLRVLSEGESIFIDNLVWDSQKFLTDNDIMIVFSNTNYDADDYITDKEKFYNIVNNKN